MDRRLVKFPHSNDHQFFHFTSTVRAISSEEKGIRDVFVLTCPGLMPPEQR
ncbi:MAG: 2OG-Fe dioxygenase family protein [Xenococcaceae cyanobacterium]